MTRSLSHVSTRHVSADIPPNPGGGGGGGGGGILKTWIAELYYRDGLDGQHGGYCRKVKGGVSWHVKILTTHAWLEMTA